jgi:hypothetical protein
MTQLQFNQSAICLWASEYRRRLGADTWHFCSNCAHWPTDDFVSLKDLVLTFLIAICVNLRRDDRRGVIYK